LAVNAASLVALTSGGAQLLDRQIFTTSGTWTKPTDFAGNVASGAAKFARLILQAPGGGGGTPFGGGPGGRFEDIVAISLLSSTETITVGTVGVGANPTGSAGTACSIGSKARAGPGGGGSSTTRGSIGYGNVPIALPANGFSPVDAPGTGGVSAGAGQDSLAAAGGAAANPGTAGSNASNQGPGGGGGAGLSGNNNGGAGGSYGGGGGGGVGTGIGGNGGPGVVVIEVYG